MSASLADSISSAPYPTLIRELSGRDLKRLDYAWWLWARKEQLPPPGSWPVWIICAGRGFGKTRAGSEWTRSYAEAGLAQRIALVGPTAADCRDVMVEGESGLLAISPPWCRPKYEPSKRKLTWPNGVEAHTYSGDEPDRLRGPSHDLAWADEIASFKRPEALDMLFFGLRLGNDPKCLVTTTPKPRPHIKALLARPDVAVTGGSTFDNAANLAAPFLTEMRHRYEGTRLGRQELHAELLEDAEGALWRSETLETVRVTQTPELVRIVVGVDPAASHKQSSAETGIIIFGVDAAGIGYVLGDDSLRAGPHEWGTAVIAAYHRHKANTIVAESNMGGDMIRHVLATIDPTVPVEMITASRGKQLRAEPIAALYTQGRVKHHGYFAELETQMTSWEPGASESPDRVDALVHAATHLMIVPHRRKVRIPGTHKNPG